MATLNYFGLLLCVFGAAVAGGVGEHQPISLFYHEHVGIPTYNSMVAAEKGAKSNVTSRIANGAPAALGQFPHLAGLLISLNIGATSVCGGTLMSNTKVLTAAHCWFDGRHQGLSVEVVLGSLMLFTGGVRVTSSEVEMHSSFNPTNLNHDIAIITIPFVEYQPGLISAVTMPDSFLLWLTFEGNFGDVAGYGVTRQNEDITLAAHARWRTLYIVHNYDCENVYGLENVIASTLCTSGQGLTGPCGGDSGGPLTVTLSGVPILVGVVSFHAGGGCDIGFPGGFARVTSYASWINARI